MPSSASGGGDRGRIAYLRGSALLGGIAVIGGEVAVIGLGIAALRDSDLLLLGVTLIGAGAAGIGGGIVVLWQNTTLSDRLSSLTKGPTDGPPPFDAGRSA